jgi:hypothetical protein
MQDPDLKRGLLRSVQIHASVLNRIQRGTDCYAPIVLPSQYTVTGGSQTTPETAAAAKTREVQQEHVWNTVWKKRVNYFAMVAVSSYLTTMPFSQAVWPPTACEGPQCLLAPMISSLAVALPGFAQTWLDAFARTPGVVAVAVVTLGLLLLRSGSLQAQIRDGMRDLWVLPHGRTNALPTNWIYKLRTNALYQRSLRYLKWKVLPFLFGSLVLAGGFVAIAASILLAANRVQIAVAERSGDQLCPARPTPRPVPPSGTIQTLGEFDTKSLCWPTGLSVDPGGPYRITVRVTGEWFDTARIPASPIGFGPERMHWSVGYLAIPLRRSITSRWFQPLAKVVSDDGSIRIYPLEMRRSDTTDVTYTADFVPTRKGSVFLFLNDAMILLWGPTDSFYKNNLGKADVWLQRIAENP